MAPTAQALRNANLNLIPVLRALLKEANVSRASDALGLSQSATSGALARLRTLLGDPLLVQVGRSMRLTPRATELIGPLEQLCGALEELLRNDEFDPAHTEREFVVAAPDFVTLLTGNRLMAELREVAPKVSVSFTDISPDLADRLAAGAVDIGVVDLSWSTWKGVAEEVVYTDRSAAVVSCDHPLAVGGTFTAEALERYPQVRWRSHAPATAQPSLLPSPSSVPIYTRNFSALPLLALQSDCVAIVPRRFALWMADILPLAVLELPYPTRPIEVGMLWSTVHESDPAHRWFRRVFERVLPSETVADGGAVARTAASLDVGLLRGATIP
jgi:LysR family transcriptional activator of mexEF-oprN operon